MAQPFLPGGEPLETSTKLNPGGNIYDLRQSKNNRVGHRRRPGWSGLAGRRANRLGQPEIGGVQGRFAGEARPERAASRSAAAAWGSAWSNRRTGGNNPQAQLPEERPKRRYDCE